MSVFFLVPAGTKSLKHFICHRFKIFFFSRNKRALCLGLVLLTISWYFKPILCIFRDKSAKTNSTSSDWSHLNRAFLKDTVGARETSSSRGQLHTQLHYRATFTRLDVVNQTQSHHRVWEKPICSLCSSASAASGLALRSMPQRFFFSTLVPVLPVQGWHPETHTELKVVHLRCTALHRCSGITPGCKCVFRWISLFWSIPWSFSNFPLFSPDLPASSLQYQCGPVDYLCSPRLVKKGPTPRPCHDRPAIKPRPQPSTSPRPPTAQKPQGNVRRHSSAPVKVGCDTRAVFIIERSSKIRPRLLSCHSFCSDKHLSITWFLSAARPHCVTHGSVGHPWKSCRFKAGQRFPSVYVWASSEECLKRTTCVMFRELLRHIRGRYTTDLASLFKWLTAIQNQSGGL